MQKSPDDGMDPVWDEMADAEEDLDQYSYYMDTLKERFLNLIELVSRRCVGTRGLNAYMVYRSSTSRTLISLITRVSYPSSRPYISRSHISPWVLQGIASHAYWVS
jgi:hypothetical protein